MSDCISQEEYRKILKKCWDIPSQSDSSFPDQVKIWLETNASALGVPFEYLSFPLISAASYCMGTSVVEVTKKYREPVIMYTLIAGRSGTNKSASLELVKNLVRELDVGDGEQKPLFDTGTLEGLLTQLKINDGSILCAVDEFSSFVDNMDKSGQGHSERARYLSLHSGSSWNKQTKGGGSVSVEHPRFNFVSFIQNYPLANSISKEKHYEGFFPRFMIAAPKEVVVGFRQKMASSNKPDNIDMSKVFQRIYDRFHPSAPSPGTNNLKMSSAAIDSLADYHDNTVGQHRLDYPFEDLKTMVLSKSISNVIRVAAIMSALRVAVADGEFVEASGSNSEEASIMTGISLSVEEAEESMSVSVSGNSVATTHSAGASTTITTPPAPESTDENIIEEDVARALKIVQYSVECILALSSGERPTKTGVRRMPLPAVFDHEFVVHQKLKVRKLFHHKMTVNNRIPLSSVTRNHIYPQYGGCSGPDVAIQFLKGLQHVGLGTFHDEGSTKGRPYFEFIDINDVENIPPDVRSLLDALDLHKVLVDVPSTA